MKEETASATAVPINLKNHAVREEILLSLVRNSMDAIESADGVIDHWNPAAEKLYGYSASEAIGKPSTLLVPDEKLAEFEEMRERLARGERIEQFVTQRLKKDGTLVEVEITVFPVLDDLGKLAATSIISHDLTERRKMEQVLEESVKLKADFLARMSHEIRTPLNAIIGTAELLRLSETSPEQRRRSGIIQTSGELLLTIVDDILDFSKLSAGKVVLENVDFNLAELAEGLVDAFSESARTKGLDFGFYLDSRISTVRGDPNRLRQVLNNLLSNAIKFTSMGEVLLRIIKVDETATDTLINFEVADTGVGISLEAQSRLFQPFVQGEASTSRKFGGTGLGLAISDQLVRQMGGDIELDSEPGIGSTFRFSLRLAHSELSPIFSTREDQFSGITALVVGNGSANREIISRYLNSRGITNRSIGEESDALAELKSASERTLNYTVVLLDNGSGDKGLGLAKTIKCDGYLNSTKIILMSWEQPTKMDNIFDAWLPKPVRPLMLFDTLYALLPQHASNSGDIAAKNESIQPPIERNGIRVLVVEDNLTNQTLIKEQLEVLGYTALAVDDGELAITTLAQRQFDIVLMDCELPGMSGYEAAKEIRRRETNGKVMKIIAFTAHVSDEQRQRCLDAGMNDYLGKPVKLRTLANTLKTYSRTEVLPDSTQQNGQKEQTEERLDPSALAEIAQLSEATGGNVFRKLADRFISDLTRQVSLITAALESGDTNKLALSLHSLKSSSMIIGATKFSAACANVEQYAREDRADTIRSLAEQLLLYAKKLPDILLAEDSYKS